MPKTPTPPRIRRWEVISGALLRIEASDSNTYEIPITIPESNEIRAAEHDERRNAQDLVRSVFSSAWPALAPMSPKVTEKPRPELTVSQLALLRLFATGTAQVWRYSDLEREGKDAKRLFELGLLISTGEDYRSGLKSYDITDAGRDTVTRLDARRKEPCR